MSIQVIKLFSIILLSLTLVTALGLVSRRLTSFQITPDVIDVVPNGYLRVFYPSGTIVNLGNELTPTQVKDQPFLYWKANPFAYYTLIMSDPDVPSRTNRTLGEACHWIVGNIPGRYVNRGQVFTDFIGSGPLQGSGLHRYLFLVFRQPGQIQFNETFVAKTNLQSRLNFKTRNFAAKYNLGNPVAGNLYQAQFDAYVPLLHATFTS